MKDGHITIYTMPEKQWASDIHCPYVHPAVGLAFIGLYL